MNKELINKTNEELAAIVVRLKNQLIESRFASASGELEKTHLNAEMRKTIAQILTILKQRGFELTIGSHGVYLIDDKTKTTKSITKDIYKAIEKDLEESTKKKAKEDKK